jgi:hypothetical protein
MRAARATPAVTPKVTVDDTIPSTALLKRGLFGGLRAPEITTLRLRRAK